MKIGIDIGGSHVGVGLVDRAGKIILKKEKDLEIIWKVLKDMNYKKKRIQIES